MLAPIFYKYELEKAKIVVFTCSKDEAILQKCMHEIIRA